MKVLVSGAAGFTGSWMMQFLSEQTGVELIGLVRKTTPLSGSIQRHSILVSDLLDQNHLLPAVAGICPDAIIHLGGLMQGSLEAMLKVNITGTKNIIDAGYNANPDCRILVISSSAVYGYQGNIPIAETTSLQPRSEYGISKMAQDAYALMRHELNDVLVSVARPFNLAGPNQSEFFICGKIVRQILEIEQKKKSALELKEITSSRDLIDVRDVVRGYWALISHPTFSQNCAGKAFNIGSGNTYPISKIIELIEEITGRHYKVNLPIKPIYVAIPSQKSDNMRIRSLTGWRPQIQLKDTLQDMLAASQRNISNKK
jgi:GDP-4-dehydro-6-deoxy-D-mannose reductase